jgi:hypothetical protein
MFKKIVFSFLSILSTSVFAGSTSTTIIAQTTMGHRGQPTHILSDHHVLIYNDSSTVQSGTVCYKTIACVDKPALTAIKNDCEPFYIQKGQNFVRHYTQDFNWIFNFQGNCVIQTHTDINGWAPQSSAAAGYLKMLNDK